MMKKFEAVNKKNGREYVVTINNDSNSAIVYDIDNNINKEVSMATIKRWYTLGKEIIVKRCEICEEAMENTDEATVCVFCDEVIQKEVEAEKTFVQSVLGKEIQEKKEKRKPSAVKKDGTVRDDKFRPKLTEKEVIEIRQKFNEGMKKSHLAKEYGVSFRTITCIVEYIMWKHVG